MRKSPDRRVPGLSLPLKESIRWSGTGNSLPNTMKPPTDPVGVWSPYSTDDLGQQGHTTKPRHGGNRGFQVACRTLIVVRRAGASSAAQVAPQTQPILQTDPRLRPTGVSSSKLGSRPEAAANGELTPLVPHKRPGTVRN